MNTLALALLPLADDPVPSPSEIGAGWLALLVFVLLATSVFFLGRSLSRQLKKTQKNADAGVFGEQPDRPEQPTGRPTEQPTERP